MSTTDPEDPERRKPGPKPERLSIDPERAGDVLDHLLGKKPGEPRQEPDTDEGAVLDESGEDAPKMGGADLIREKKKGPKGS